MTVHVVGLPNDEKAKHPWMRQLVVPYIVVFSLASVVSVGTLVQKARLFSKQIRERRRAAHAGDGSDGGTSDRDNGSILLGGVEISAEFAGVDRIKQLKANFDENHLERRKLFCDVLLGFFEGLYTSSKIASSCEIFSNTNMLACVCRYADDLPIMLLPIHVNARLPPAAARGCVDVY